MNTNKEAIKQGTAKVASFILGDLHFLLQTGADLTAHAEAKIVNRLTGKPISDIKEDRYAKTYKTQAEILKFGEDIFSKMKGMHMPTKTNAVEEQIITNNLS